MPAAIVQLNREARTTAKTQILQTVTHLNQESTDRREKRTKILEWI